ncbi:MAG: hypothetical protein H0X28_06845 [Solirubrobacterales bacterium]|nr:hypothetical protein [Solirubrobacterales bacterium]
MLSRSQAATIMGFREQLRRPLLLILLVVVPAYVITRSIATTQATPHLIGLPGGTMIITTMKALHGAVMAGTAIAFVAGLCGVFVMQSALSGDRRLVIAGFHPGEMVLARLAVLGSDVALVLGVSLAVTALYFTPASWLQFTGAAALIGVIYGLLGALCGAVLDKLSATYLILFAVMTDLGIVQNPMFGNGTPGRWAVLMPGYGPVRVMVGGAYSPHFDAGGELLLSLAWAAALGIGVYIVLRRAVAVTSSSARAPASE